MIEIDLIMFEALYFLLFQPFSVKLSEETDPDKKAMLERLLGKVKIIVEVVQIALRDKGNKQRQLEAKQVRKVICINR